MSNEKYDANKAAEEGELPALPEEYYMAYGNRTYDEDHMRAYARQAIAADRASRQVANKAEVERDAARYRWLRNPDTDVALVIDKQTGFVNPMEGVPGVGGYHTYEYRAGDELDAAIDAAMGIAAPPATTGASTVLTDARIEEIYEGIGHTCTQTDITFARAIERETLIAALIANDKKIDPVAAQAGQVAVPEGWKLVPIEGTRKMKKAGLTALRKLLGSTVDALEVDACYAAMLAATPLSASESLRSPQEAAGTEKGANQ